VQIRHTLRGRSALAEIYGTTDKIDFLLIVEKLP
jgi:hypothetical protein